MNILAKPVTDRRAPTGPVRAYAILNGLVLLGVLLQGLSAGGLMGRLGGPAWLALHRITAFVVVILSLAEAVLAATTLRGRRPIVVAWSFALFALLVIQTALGQAISDGHERALVAIHVPLAMLIMGVGACLSVAAFRLRRSS